MRVFRKILLGGAVWVFWLLLPMHAQKHTDLEFAHISLDEGLSQAAVYTIAQDRFGFMWFGTLDGLNRYDGYDIKVFKHDPADDHSISGNRITALSVDAAGELWIGTGADGLNRYDPATEKFSRYRHNPDISSSLSDDRVRAIYADAAGNLWVGTFASVLDQFVAASDSFAHFPLETAAAGFDNRKRILTIAGDEKSSGNLWVGTYGNGLALFDRENGEFEYYLPEPNAPGIENINIIQSIFIPPGGVRDWILLGSWGSGLLVLNPLTSEFRQHYSQSDNIRSISDNTIYFIRSQSADDTNLFWIGTDNGLNIFNRQSGDFNHYRHTPVRESSLSNNRVYTAAVSRGGDLWLGTLGGGVNHYHPKKRKFNHIKPEPFQDNSLNDKFIRSLWEDRRGNVWVGTGNGGLNFLNPANNKFKHYSANANGKSVSHNSIRSLLEDEKGNIWIGTDGGGLDMLAPETGIFRHFLHDPKSPVSISNDRIWALRKSRKPDGEHIWIGTYGGGLNRLELNAARRGIPRFERWQSSSEDDSGLASNAILALWEDSRANLWVGSDRGLQCFDSDINRMFHFQHDPTDSSSLSHQTVINIFESSKGTLWVGTFGGGLNRFDPQTKTFQRYTEANGLPSDIINGILEDESGNLWLSTYQGLCVFDPDTETFKNFNLQDGLQSREFGYGAYHLGKSGKMYFGGVNGFNIFRPEDIQDNAYQPPVVLTAFQIFGEAHSLQPAVTVNRQITLSYYDNHFSFEFAALDYIAPRENRYAYKLEGFNTDWVDNGRRRFANFTNLDPGEYTFRVKGSNNDGIWNTQGAEVQIIITPPFWQTWWFRLLLGAGILGILLMLHRYRLGRALELERLRVRIASDLHDDIGASLTRIAVHSEIIQNTADGEKIARSSRKIGEMSREIVRTLSDIVWAIDARNDTLGDLIGRIKLYAREVLPEDDVETYFKIEKVNTNRKLPLNLRQNIYLIFKEAFNNIARHSDAENVHFMMTERGQYLTIDLSDDGKGLSEKESLTGNGLRNMKMRAEQIGADLKIEDKSGVHIILILKHQ